LDLRANKKISGITPDVGISVIICCYNSALRLPKTLQHLRDQIVRNDLEWEIVVVDNASTDDTSIIANQILSAISIDNFSYQLVDEKRPGLSFARLKGVKVAKYEIILFCDDDNWLDPNYLQEAFDIFKVNPSLGALGGQSKAASEVPLPGWFEEYQEAFAVGKQGEVTGNITGRGYVWGAGLVTRRNLFLSTYSEDLPSLLTDRRGNELTSGGDNEYCQRLILLRYQLFYSEKLRFTHYMAPSRLTIEYRDRLLKAFEESSGIVYQYTEAIQLKYSSKFVKIKLLTAAIKDIAIKKITGKKSTHRSFKILYFLLGLRYKTDKKLQLIKRFYDT